MPDVDIRKNFISSSRFKHIARANEMSDSREALKQPPKATGKRDTQAAGTIADSETIKEIIRCSDDCAYFIERYVKILDYRTQSAIPFKLWPEQRRVLDEWQSHKRTITLKSRQLGITWLALGRMLWKCMLHPYEHGLIVAVDEQFALELIGRIRFMYSNLPEWLQVPLRKPESMARMVWPETHSLIEAETSSTTAGTGGTYSIVLLDEWAKHRYAEQVWPSIRPAIDMCDLMIVSTANGIGNLFHTQWVQAERKQNTFHPIFLPWWAKPGRDEKWYEEQLLDLGPAVKQEYPATPDEAFLSTGNPVFDRRFLYQPSDVPVTDLGIPGMKVYALPEEGKAYAFGWDASEGLEGIKADSDFSAGVGFCKQTGEQVVSYKARVPPEELAVIIDRLARLYKISIHAIERNQHGYATILRCKDLATPNLYCQRDVLTGARPTQKRIGWVTNSSTKPLMIDNLNELLRSGLIKIKCAELYEQLFYYEELGRGRTGAPAGMHDDLAVAAMLAAMMLREVKTWRPEDIRRGSALEIENLGD